MLGSLIAAFASGEAFYVLRRMRRAVMAYAVALVAALTGAGFLVGAGYVAAARRYGTIEAAIGFGLGFLVIASIIVGVHTMASRRRARSAANRRTVDMTTIASAAAISALPLLMRGGKGGVGAVVAPAIAVLAYAIYRENRKKAPPDGEAD